MKFFTKLCLTVSILTFNNGLFAHDGGHGPKLNDAGKHGGKVTAVVLKSERELGPKAKLVHKSEIVKVKEKDGTNTVRVYFYDVNMKTLDISKFAKSGNAVVEYEKGKKKTEIPFKLSLNGTYFIAKKVPDSPVKPFNIDVFVNDTKKDLLAAFDGLE